jgi:hypothetical protein
VRSVLLREVNRCAASKWGAWRSTGGLAPGYRGARETDVGRLRTATGARPVQTAGARDESISLRCRHGLDIGCRLARRKAPIHADQAASRRSLRYRHAWQLRLCSLSKRPTDYGIVDVATADAIGPQRQIPPSAPRSRSQPQPVRNEQFAGHGRDRAASPPPAMCRPITVRRRVS